MFGRKSEKKQRDCRLDFTRMILVFLVIAIHSDLSSLDADPVARSFVVGILFTADGAFFTISGYFLLNRNLHTGREYGLYYLKRFIAVIFPWIMLHLFMDILFNRYIFSIGFTEYVKAYFKNLLVNDYNSYLWFMYSYIPIIICAPFFAKMLNHMRKMELVILAGLCMGFILYNELATTTNFGNPFNNFAFLNWTMYFFMGFYLRKFSGEVAKHKILAGIACIASLYLVAWYTVVYAANPGILLFRPYYLVFVFLFLFFLTYVVPVEKIPGLGAVSRFVAKHSFSIYLTHIYVISFMDERLEKWIPASLPLGVNNLLCYLLHIVFSVLFAFLYDELIIFRLQDLLRWLFRVKKLEKAG